MVIPAAEKLSNSYAKNAMKKDYIKYIKIFSYNSHYRLFHISQTAVRRNNKIR